MLRSQGRLTMHVHGDVQLCSGNPEEETLRVSKNFPGTLICDLSSSVHLDVTYSCSALSSPSMLRCMRTCKLSVTALVLAFYLGIRLKDRWKIALMLKAKVRVPQLKARLREVRQWKGRKSCVEWWSDKTRIRINTQCLCQLYKCLLLPVVIDGLLTRRFLSERKRRKKFFGGNKRNLSRSEALERCATSTRGSNKGSL